VRESSAARWSGTGEPKRLPAGIFLARQLLLPAALYLACFILLTYPLITRFSTGCFCDSGDGLQNVWNLWWVNEAVTRLHQSPWSTTYLHYPFGVSLLGHTLNPFNGFIAIPLLRLFSLTQTYNLIVVFSFVAGGVTTFLLAYHLIRSYLPALIAGFIFTFSSYHLAHVTAHLQLVALEWIPLFILLWYRLLTERRLLFAAGAAAALFLVILCDYYYFLYCCLAAALLLVYWLVRNRHASPPVPWRSQLVPLAVFLGLAAVSSGLLLGALLRLNHTDPLLGAHSPTGSPLDLLQLLIPGSTWRFGGLTRGYWSHLPVNLETHVNIGLAVLIAAAYALSRRKRPALPGAWIWGLTGLIFAALALGPLLHVWGVAVDPPFPMPYTLLSDVVPVLRVGGVPARMMVMTLLCAAVLAAAGFDLLFRRGRSGRLAAAVLLAALIVEDLPAPLTTTRLAVPGYILALERAHGAGAVLDLRDDPTHALYFQTLYQRPQALGYISRVPASVFTRDDELLQWASRMRGDVLYRTYHIRYLIAPAGTGDVFDRRLYHGDGADLFDLSRAASPVVTESAQPLAQVPVGELLPGHSIGQTFTAHRDGLRGVGLLLSTYGQALTGPLIVHLRAVGQGADLHVWRLDLSAVNDDMVRVFTFPPIAHARGHRYAIELDAPRGRLGRTITVWASAGDTYPRGTLTIDHHPAPGDLTFQLCYARQPMG
jgi:hypothetical protein